MPKNSENDYLDIYERTSRLSLNSIVNFHCMAMCEYFTALGIDITDQIENVRNNVEFLLFPGEPLYVALSTLLREKNQITNELRESFYDSTTFEQPTKIVEDSAMFLFYTIQSLFSIYAGIVRSLAALGYRSELDGKAYVNFTPALVVLVETFPIILIETMKDFNFYALQDSTVVFHFATLVPFLQMSALLYFIYMFQMRIRSYPAVIGHEMMHSVSKMSVNRDYGNLNINEALTNHLLLQAFDSIKRGEKYQKLKKPSVEYGVKQKSHTSDKLKRKKLVVLIEHLKKFKGPIIDTLIAKMYIDQNLNPELDALIQEVTSHPSIDVWQMVADGKLSLVAFQRKLAFL